jgi:RNA polymerase sigma-70 factor (ECF subfamily)
MPNDDATITEFVHRDYARLVNAVALLLRERSAAEDLVQEALARAWERMDRGVRIESLPNWVAAVALNLARSRWRRLLVERRAQQRWMTDSEQPPSNAEAVDVARALAALPRRQREVAVLRYLLAFPTRDVAEVLGVSEGTVKNSLSKARAALAAALAIDDEEVPSDAER